MQMIMGAQFGPYQILGPLGAGGMGVGRNRMFKGQLRSICPRADLFPFLSKLLHLN